MKLTLDTSTLPRPPRWAVALAAVGLIAGAVLYLERVHDEQQAREHADDCAEIQALRRSYWQAEDWESWTWWTDIHTRKCLGD